MNIEKKRKQAQKVLLDLKKNHNWSWIKEINERNKNNLNDVALFYRGTEITYNELLNVKRVEFAKSLKAFNVTKESEVPLCMSNCPEFIYVLSAISTLGAKFNSFGSGFDKQYIKEIIDGCDSEILIITDDLFEDLKTVIPKDKKVVLISLSDSLENGVDPYNDIDSKFKSLENKVDLYKLKYDNIISLSEFIEKGKNVDLASDFFENVNLTDEFSITYSSGSTNSTRPKAIVHDNMSYIVVGRFHDDDVSELPTMRKRRVLAHIPGHSNTNITSSISDALMQDCTVTLEPIYDINFFPYSLLINKSNVVEATRSFWVNFAKAVNSNYYNDDFMTPSLKNIDVNQAFKELVGPFAVGEPISPGEEKYINQALRKIKAGANHLPLILPSSTISIGGGDCEHGGLFILMFKPLKDKMPRQAITGDKTGLNYFKYASLAVLDDSGNRLENGQAGRLVGKSPCDMLYYKNDPEATENFYCVDSKGKKWTEFNVYGYIDKFNNVHIKGRINKNDTYPPFKIADAILRDTKNIMSCEVTPVNYLDEQFFVASIEFNPDRAKDKALVKYDLSKAGKLEKNIISVEKRCRDLLPGDISAKIIYRVINNEQSFPLTGCGKRNILKLKEMNFSHTFKMLLENNFIMTGEEYVKSYYDYLHRNDNGFVFETESVDEFERVKSKVKSKFKGQK